MSIDKQHWMDVLPADPYTVTAAGYLHNFHRQVLTMLYQPIIGSQALSLYMTLWGECEQTDLHPNTLTHHSLMLGMKNNLKSIYEQRLILEGIGLLKVYEGFENSTKKLLYELQSPLDPHSFFEDPILNIFLFKTIGKTQYQRTKNFFSRQAFSKDGFREISRSFDSVFQTITVEQLNEIQQSNDLSTSNDTKILQDSQSVKISVKMEEFDYDLFLDGLSDSFVPKRSFTSDVKETILKLAFLYGINPIQMKTIVMRSLNEENKINIETLRLEARDWYQFQHHEALPTIVEKVQPIQHRQMGNEQPTTQEEKLIHCFETISPRQYLKEISGGAEPSEADLKIIEEIMIEQKLLPGVANVLIDYVMIRLDKKLSKNYVIKIASHWARKGVTTVKQAMDLARKEFEETKQSATAAKTRTNNRRNKAIRTEIVPDWLQPNTTTEVPKDSVAKKSTNDSSIDEERKRLEKELEMFKNKKKR
ncbi:replication initiation and membrane attachment family protein [Bacillus sp. AFS017336]|uniref:replication initiation and membrane attachment family protein n=1 Tax=Bacillus sp. AFS017336 TaxID=2033489 RepID=UPI000BF2464C|nr:DnaD domain protein [Bacillus sp. AFS017336]PEK99638.1 Replication initiation and membrane attachment protein [Bacillus sp. AFS017336]